MKKEIITVTLFSILFFVCLLVFGNSDLYLSSVVGFSIVLSIMLTFIQLNFKLLYLIYMQVGFILAHLIPVLVMELDCAYLNIFPEAIQCVNGHVNLGVIFVAWGLYTFITLIYTITSVLPIYYE